MPTLEEDYSPRLLVDDLQPYLERYAALSAQARAQLAVTRDLAYGPSADEVLDLFPAPAVGAPLQVFIHGGYWRLLSKEQSAFAAPMFVRRGAAFAALNYALAPHARLDEIVRQCRAAVAWLHANAARFGYDPQRIFVSGSSAGGHLVAMLLAAGWHGAFGVPADVVKGGLALSGLFDLEPLLGLAINQTLRLDAAEARRNSPQRLPLAQGAGMLVAWAEVETGAWKRQNRAYAARWAPLGGASIEIAGRNHYDVVLDLADPSTELARRALAQMGLQ